MSYYDIEYLADSLVLEALAKDDLMIKTAAEGGVIASLALNIKNYVLSQFDKERPIASIAAFMGPGLLWKLGFPWMGVLYEVAAALGFDWISFWDAVKNGVVTFVRALTSSGARPSEDELSSKVGGIISESANSNFAGEPDLIKLKNVVTKNQLKTFTQDLSDALAIKKLAIDVSNNKELIKEAGIMSLFRGKLVRFFIRVVSWVVKTGLISLGITAGAGAISSLLGIHKVKNEYGDSASTPSPTDTSTRAPVQQLQMSKSVSRDLFTYHRNDIDEIWIEKSNIVNIENEIMGWILNAYPQLNTYRSSIESSAGFLGVIQKFDTRNRLAHGIGLVSVPPPYQRKIDIVSEIVNRFLKDHGSELQKQQDEKNESQYTYYR